ncbi:MAG: FHA domain-containing protein [Peptococcaceae bacterium]|nr:FHA domain-containing protein [Peptococcaceae bacterium]
MNLQRCPNGHFYDSDSFRQCPHCGSPAVNDAVTVSLNRDVNATVALDQAGLGDAVTSKLSDPDAGSLREAVNKAAKGGAALGGGDSVTISYYNKAIGTEPVVGWLVCVGGNHFGEDFRLKSGRNFIGRGSDMDVSISGDNTVSREKHAVVVYEPKQHLFLAQPGESKELFYLNDEVVLATTVLRHRDVLTVGETSLMFFPCCGEEFNWDMVKKGEEEK